MNTRSNTLAAIRHQQPAFVPVFDGTVWASFALGDNYRSESWTDHWGTVWRADLPGLAPVDVGHPLADLARLDDYAWPDPRRLTWTPADQAAMDAVDRQRMLVGGVHVKFLAERLCCLMGMDHFLVGLYEEPDRVQVVIDRVVEYNLVCLRRLMDLGVDILHVAEDLGTAQGPMLSPAMFRRFLMPAYERCFAEVKARGVMLDFHSDGAIAPLLPDLLTLPLTVLNPLEVRAVPQQAARDAVKGRVATLGGIDSKVVHTGTPDQVRAEVRRAFALWQPGAGWIAAPDQVVVGAPPANVAALWESCWELAPY
jgi:uroporphyrinogen decarboxylase